MPRTWPSIGIALAASPAWMAPKIEADPGPLVDPATQQVGHVHHDPAQRVHEVGGQVRSGGVAAGAGQADLDHVGRRGERAGPDRDQPGRQLREAVQREDRLDVLQTALGDHLGGAGRELLLAGLEDQAHPAGQLAPPVQLGQREAGPEQDRGVHVVAAGVADVGHGGPVRHVLDVGQRQRVQVGPDGDDAPAGPAATGADVADDPVALGHQARLQAGVAQQALDEGGGFELGPGQLRVGVDVAADRDESAVLGADEVVELTRQWYRVPWCRPHSGVRHG